MAKTKIRRLKNDPDPRLEYAAKKQAEESERRKEINQAED